MFLGIIFIIGLCLVWIFRYGGVYLFGVIVFFVGEKFYGYFFGYGRFYFYDGFDNYDWYRY